MSGACPNVVRKAADVTSRHRAIQLGFLLSAVMAVTATVLMLLPPQATKTVSVSVNDKIMHFVAFFMIVLPAIAVRPSVWVWVLPIAIVLGGMIEIVQPFFGRGRELGDFIADVLGATLAVPVGRLLHHVISQGWQLHKAKRAN